MKERVTDEEMKAAGVWVDPGKATLKVIQAFPGYCDGRLDKRPSPPQGKGRKRYNAAYKDGKEQHGKHELYRGCEKV